MGILEKSPFLGSIFDPHSFPLFVDFAKNGQKKAVLSGFLTPFLALFGTFEKRPSDHAKRFPNKLPG
jgi:hypothetical protein